MHKSQDKNVVPFAMHPPDMYSKQTRTLLYKKKIKIKIKIKKKTNNSQAYTCPATPQFNLSRMAHVAIRHSTI
jgi:hypothetical protein